MVQTLYFTALNQSVSLHNTSSAAETPLADRGRSSPLYPGRIQALSVALTVNEWGLTCSRGPPGRSAGWSWWGFSARAQEQWSPTRTAVRAGTRSGSPGTSGSPRCGSRWAPRIYLQRHKVGQKLTVITHILDARHELNPTDTDTHMVLLTNL